MKGSVTEFNYPFVKVNDAVTVVPLVEKTKIPGKIESVSQLPQEAQGDSANLGESGGTNTSKYNFTASVEKPIQYGFNVEVRLPLQTLRIPKKAVVKENNQYIVYKVVAKKATKTPVIVKEATGYYEVENGLKEKEEIVTNPDDNLKDGVEITK